MGGVYGRLAAVRRAELRTRLVVAVVLAAMAYFIAPSMGPLAWLCLVFVSQMGERAFFQTPSEDPGRGELAAWAATIALASVIYCSLGVYLWFRGGEVGRSLALLLGAGSLLHVTIHMYHVRLLLLAANLPHALVFLGLPISAAVSGEPLMWTILLGAILFLAHLAVTFRQASSTTRQFEIERNRAEESNRAKSDFLATISHEIRTPMNAIVSAANLLRHSRLNKAQREQVEVLTDANEVLLSLLNDVLDLSKIEAGKMTLEVAGLELDRTLQGLHRLWRPRAADKGLDLRLEIDPAVPAAVMLDALRLKQILFNLISNAVKFTHAGSVTIRLGTDKVAGEDMLAFEVIDTGVGIPPEVAQRLFGAFEQGDAGTTRKHGGSGLGLAISRRLASLMGGAIELRSTPGQGSTFRLLLPLVPAAGCEEIADEAEASTGDEALRGLRVLVADDHPINQRIVELLLAPFGCQLTFCDDGAQAVELAGVQAFDAVLMDMQMPVLDGVEATRQIKAGGGPNAGAPIIALTANALDHHRAAWAEVGVHAFVSKPIDPRQLIASLAAAASRIGTRRAA